MILFHIKNNRVGRESNGINSSLKPIWANLSGIKYFYSIVPYPQDGAA